MPCGVLHAAVEAGLPFVALCAELEAGPPCGVLHAAVRTVREQNKTDMDQEHHRGNQLKNTRQGQQWRDNEKTEYNKGSTDGIFYRSHVFIWMFRREHCG